MCEMAAHIGAYEVLLICQERGGDEVYIPGDAERNPFRALIGVRKAAILSSVYRRETVAIPTARYAISVARRAPIIAAARAGELTVADLARILRVRRAYASRLVNQTDEGEATAPAPFRAAQHDPRQMDIFSVIAAEN